MGKRGTLGVLLAAASLAVGLAGCAQSPPPSAAELGMQAAAIVEKCDLKSKGECFKMREDFCKGMNSFTGRRGKKMDTKVEFGYNWMSVEKAMRECPNVAFS
jgi:hypothetical protein